MLTSQPKITHNILTQISAINFQLDLDYSVLSITGNSEVFGFYEPATGQKVFNFLPETLSNEIESLLINCFRSNRKIEKTINYEDVFYKGKRLRAVISLVFNNGTTEYSVTLLNLPNSKALEDEIVSYDSYEEAKRQLAISEDRFNSYFENDPVMHVCVNPNTGLIADCNLFALEKLGYESKEAILGKHIKEFFLKKDRAHCIALFKKYLKTGKLSNEEITIHTKDGKSIPILLYTTSQLDENGKVILSRSTLVDVSELKNAQKKIQIKRIRLERLNKELEQFVSTCSHDLQEPLATIKFAGDVISKLYSDKLDEKGKNYLSYIDEAVDRSSNQIKSLLVHAKLGENAKRSLVDIDKVVKVALKDLGRSIHESNATIEIENKLPKIEGFEVELRLLFQNLISNAIKYTHPERNPEIKVNFRQCNEYTEFSITDNGIGISEKDTKEIFKIFNRVNDENPNKGNGVGLAHCEKIVHMHGGELWVESIPDFGSTFYVKLRRQFLD